MGLIGWIFYIVLGIILYFVVNILEKKYNLSKIDKIIFSNIFIIIISGICFRYAIRYTDNIFLVFVFMMVTDIIFNTYIVDRDFFDKDEENIKYYLIMVIIGFIINQEFINDVTEVFLTGNDLRIILWLLVFVYLYSFCKGNNIFNKNSNVKNKYMSVNSVLSSFAKLKYLYYDDCDYDNKEISNMIYAIMIYENNRRSKILRDYDNFMYKINGKNNKLGIMQIESKKFISDSESIKIAYNRINKIYNKRKNKDISKIFDEYYGYNNDYVKYIFDIIKKF